MNILKRSAAICAALVLFAAKGVRLGFDLARLGVESDHLVDEGQFCVLELILDILFDDVGVLAKKFDIDHGCDRPFCP